MKSDYCMNIVECKADYENFNAICPHCQEWNIFNRVSDLKTLEPIWGLTVKCQFCDKEFRIGNDDISSNYQKLILSCADFMSQKEYMQCIINLSIAYEIFFAHILFYFLVEKINVKEENKDELTRLLNQKIEKYTYSKLYNEFFKVLFRINEEHYFNDSCIKCYIEKINGNKCKNIKENIRKIKNTKIKHCLYYLYKLEDNEKSINYLRNKVVHKQGYRPTFQEVKKENKVARFFVLKLNSIIKKTYNN